MAHVDMLMYDDASVYDRITYVDYLMEPVRQCLCCSIITLSFLLGPKICINLHDSFFLRNQNFLNTNALSKKTIPYMYIFNYDAVISIEKC